MKRLLLSLLFIPLFFVAQSQTIVAYPGMTTPIIEELDISGIAADTMIYASLPPKTSHVWSSDVLLRDLSGDTYVYLWVRKQDILGNYYLEPYNQSPGDTLGSADSSFFFEDKMNAQVELGLQIIKGTGGILNWDLTVKQ